MIYLPIFFRASLLAVGQPLPQSQTGNPEKHRKNQLLAPHNKTQQNMNCVYNSRIVLYNIN